MEEEEEGPLCPLSPAGSMEEPSHDKVPAPYLEMEEDEQSPLSSEPGSSAALAGHSLSSGHSTGSEEPSPRSQQQDSPGTAYTGPFCGRARVHTDFTPSPYDRDSLKLRVSGPRVGAGGQG